MEALLDALAVLFPVDCAGCGAADRSVCADCRAALGPPVTTSLPGLEVRSAARYEGSTRRLVLALKEQGRTDVAGALAAAMRPLLATASTLVVLPSSREAFRRRGFDPVGLLVRRAGYRAPRLLRTTRTTEAQKSLDLEGRARNTAGALAAVTQLAGLRVTLVDDVVTTGSTLLEAARALREAGGVVDGAVTLAATPRHFVKRQ